MKLPHHGGGIREELGVETVIAHFGPVEKIADDDVNRQIPALILPGNIQELLLIPVTQLALPEAQAVLRHLRRETGGLRIVPADFRGGVPRGDEIIHLLCGIRPPGGAVDTERHFSDGGIMPEEAVAQAGDVKGDACLGIPVGQLQGGTLPVQRFLLVLPHAADALAVPAFKGDGQGKVPAQMGLEFPAPERQGVGRGCFPEEELRFLIIEGQGCVMVPVVHGDAGGELPHCNGRGFVPDIQHGFRWLLIQQGPAVIPDFTHQDRLDSHAVRTPGGDYQRFAVVSPDQPAAILCKIAHENAPPAYFDSLLPPRG